MSTVRTCEKILFKTSKFIRCNLATVGEIKNIQKKKMLWESVELTEEQERQIQSFYTAHYGKRIPTMWHRLYTSYTGVFHHDYFPEILLSTRLEPITNPYREAEFLGDKNLLPVFFKNSGGIHVPRTYISSVKGILRNSEEQVISREMAIDVVAGIQECVIKKTNNTFRVITYICDDEIHTCPVALRIGRSNADKDNIHYGGICVGVNSDGSLKKTAFSEFGEKFDHHPDTGTVFENYSICGADSVIREQAKRLHSLVPWLGIISWDLSIDVDGKITIIEMNTTGQSAWFCQMVNGEPLFGDNTGKMLEIIR